MGEWGFVPGTPTQQGYVGLALIVGTGLATSSVALSHASRTPFGPGEALYVFTPVVVSIALVVTGTLLWTANYDGSEMLRIGTGVFLGMAVFGLLVTWTITHEIIRGDSMAHAPFVTVNSMSIGGFVGLILGWLDARNRRYATKLEQERNKFKQQTEELDEFASIVSHDLRNPLNVATLELKTAKANADEETSAALEEVESSLARMEHIIDDVLTMAREGNAIGELERVSLAEVAEHSWGNVDTSGATLDVTSSVFVMADRGALEHVFENLFRNAIEHGLPGDSPEHDDLGTTSRKTSSDGGTAPTGQLAIEDGREQSRLTVRLGTFDDGFYVEDDGTGIPSEAESSLFESGVTTNEQGTGFGLSIVEKLVTAHGWQVRATASDAGGARFEISDVEFVDEPAGDSWLADLD